MLGDEGELSFIVTSETWSPQIEIKILLPKGFSKVSGDLFWTGDISAGQITRLRARVKAEEEGDWVIEGNIMGRFGHNVMGKSDFLYVSISQSLVKISKTNPRITIQMDAERLEAAQFSQSDNIVLFSSGTVVVYGWWYFREEDGTTQRPIRQATVELWDTRADGGDRLVATAYTDDNGYYEFPPVSNDVYAIFVKILTDGLAVQVSSGGYVYCSQTTIHYNIPDGSYSMGSWVVSGGSTGAFGIFDTIIIGYDYAYSLGYYHEKVQAKWPSSGTYTELNGLTLNFLSGDEWDEDVILHEYGHSVQHGIYGEWIPNSGGPHHAWNQPTNPDFAFSEGWPTFWAVATNLEMGYGDAFYPKDTWYRDHVDVIINHDLETDPHTPGDDVEGAIACTLWDVYDLNDDGRDNLDATMTPIWDVFKNYFTGGHHAYTIHDFWDGWLARGWDNIQSMWGIYFDHGIQKDSNPPFNPTGWNSSHTIGGTSSDNTIDMSWWGASDDISGVYGYSFAWTTSSTTIPDMTVDTTGTSTTSQGLSNGGWYFHIRTIDYAGNWNPNAVHVGPFYIICNRYMRSDQNTTNGLTAYNLGTEQSSIAKSFSANQVEYWSAYWGIKVWKRSSSGTETELSSGYVAQVSRASKGSGLQSATWNCPETSLNATDSIVIRVYQKIGDYAWQLAATFTTEQLNATQLDNSIWQVYYYTQLTFTPIKLGEKTIAIFYWGTTTTNSHIQNMKYN
jgi:hypothetical protein